MAERDASSLSYRRYLHLDRLLDCQHPESGRQGEPAHDEMLFIVVHQAYELWFKQILYELDGVLELFAASPVPERDIGRAVRSLGRIHAILELGVRQLDVLETMTPLDFLEFRDLLTSASGFQSQQFRLMETRLGLREEDRIGQEGESLMARLDAADRPAFAEALAQPSLFERIDAWLARTPYVNFGGFDFREAYRSAVHGQLAADLQHLASSPGLSDTRRDAERSALESAQNQFAAIFDAGRHGQAGWRFSREALQAALFIALYRDEPMLQLPFRLIELLMDIDETLALWRRRHALMVERMIGRKLGTGGSSGADYLSRTADAHRIFGDLFALSTFLVPRSALPPLPETLRRALAFGEQARSA